CHGSAAGRRHRDSTTRHRTACAGVRRARRTQVKTYVSVVALAIASTLMLGSIARAQDKPAPRDVVVPLKIQVVISRFQGDKRLSNLPYTLSLSVKENGLAKSNIRMGTKIPINMMAQPSVDGKPAAGVPMAGPINYQDVGTNIDCTVVAHDEGRFAVDITIDD